MGKKKKRSGIGKAFRGLYAIVCIVMAIVGITAIAVLIFAFAKFFRG